MTFCPSGRSSNILKTYSKQLDELAATGHVSAQSLADTQNVTLQKVMAEGARPTFSTTLILVVFMALGVCLIA